MPDHRRHRGPAPGDRDRFAAAALPALRAACRDLAWLLGRGYAETASLQLVGDRFRLDQRQRQAVRRATCTDEQRTGRRARALNPGLLRDATLWLDGFNVLTTVETAMSGGAVLGCLDGNLRDLASVHGTWRRVDETLAAAALLGTLLEDLGVAAAVWLLDAPVGNSGRLAALLRRLADERAFGWRVELVADPDRVLAATTEPVATADSAILDARVRWFELARHAVARVPDAWIVDLAAVPPGEERDSLLGPL